LVAAAESDRELGDHGLQAPEVAHIAGKTTLRCKPPHRTYTVNDQSE